MRSRRAIAALLAAALLVIGPIAAPPTSYEYQPVLVINPVEHVNTLIGTGTAGATAARPGSTNG
jgi:putative alpha-1,2-mannosidase